MLRSSKRSPMDASVDGLILRVFGLIVMIGCMMKGYNLEGLALGLGFTITAHLADLSKKVGKIGERLLDCESEVDQ